MKYTLYILYTLMAVMAGMTSCKKTDDIDQIFTSKTWYMTSGMIQGQPITGENLKKFFTSDKTYVLNFGSGALSGALSAGLSLNGAWAADGKTNDMKLQFTGSPTAENPFDSNLLNILRNVVRYSGDENIVTLYADGDNYIGFSSKRSAQSEY